MFIVLEGIDGSGKSSLVTLLANRLGGVAYATPPKKYRELRRSVDTSSTIQKHYEFYRDAVIEASSEISDILSSGQTVVCDRYWLSTLVYHKAGGMALDGSDFLKLIQPDLTIFLIVSPEVQMIRSDKRGGEGGNINGFQSKLTNLYWETLVEFRLPFLCINTDNISLMQCGNIALAATTKI